MLDFLHIENIAVIELSDISFVGGFNVLTGETGAGKSIIIDSINAVLGARTSKELVRAGCKTACVSAQFSGIGDEAVSALENAGFSLDEEGKLILSRNITVDGKTSFRVNGVPANAATVREIGKYLINIHGQHDNQSLLNPEKHCTFIDKLADNQKIKDDYYAEFKRFLSIRKELSALQTDEEEKERKTELLKYQINELENADIKIGEHDKLKEQLKAAQNFEKNCKLLESADLLLRGNENPGICELLADAAKSVVGVNTVRTDKIAEKLTAIQNDLTDVSAELQNYIESELHTELNIEEIQNRLDLLHSLMLKYGGSEQSMLEFLSNAKLSLDNIVFAESREAQLEDELESAEKALIEKAEKLSESRKKAARIFSDNVCNALKFLDMPNIRFNVDFKKGKYGKNGCDAVEFLISANAGEELKPLSKIASGGELSRVMLAIKSILSDKDEVATLIFDEIDTGISGHAATKVAYKLRQLANNVQVICVTHLAQIAAYAQNHMLIEKNTNNGRTYTTVKQLDYNSRIAELARIMSGTEITENMFNSAKELLDRSMKNENL